MLQFSPTGEKNKINKVQLALKSNRANCAATRQCNQGLRINGVKGSVKAITANSSLFQTEFFSSSLFSLFLNADKAVANVSADDYLLHSAHGLDGWGGRENYLFHAHGLFIC